MYGPCLFVTSSAIHRVEDSRETATEPREDVDQQLCAFLLILFGDVLFCHTSSVVFLPLLADLDRVGEYAWGATSLSFLYLVLFRFSDGSSHQLGGNLPIFQVYRLSLLIKLQYLFLCIFD